LVISVPSSLGLGAASLANVRNEKKKEGRERLGTGKEVLFALLDDRDSKILGFEYYAHSLMALS
jgi:hypothetical protein